MSNAAPGQPAEPKVRPTTVTAATWLLLGVAVLSLVGSVAVFSQLGTMSEVVEEAYAGTEAEGAEAIGTFSAAFGGVINLLLAIGFAVLALFNHRGSNASRIITWVLGGIALCCNGIGLVLSQAMSNMQLEAGDGPDPAEIQRLIEEALPGWYTAITWITGIGALLVLIVVVVLLALPPSNRFFRKPVPPAEPPPPYPSAP